MEDFQLLTQLKPTFQTDKTIYKTLFVEYVNDSSRKIRINLKLDDTFTGTDDILEFSSLLNGACFLLEIGLPEIVFFGGSLIKNGLDIPESKIDDFDTGYFDNDTKRGEGIVSNAIARLVSGGKWKILDRSANKINLPLVKEKIDFFLESGAQAFLISDIPFFSGKIFEFGNEDTLESTLNMENISATLKITKVNRDETEYDISCSLREKNIELYLNELRKKQANINQNVENFATKFDILQRFLITTIKYGVSMTDDKNPLSALNILKNFCDNDFFLAKTGEYRKLQTREDLIILEKRKEFCLNKFFALLTRITPIKREIYLHNLIESKILIPFLPDIHEMLADKNVRGELLKRGDIKDPLTLYSFIQEKFSIAKKQTLSTTRG